MRKVIPFIALWLFLGATARASELENLARKGYGVIIETSVNGTFNGCEYGRQIPLQDGLIFVCQGYQYAYAYDPDVLILKNVRNGDIKIIIDDDEYDGQLVRR